MCALGSGSLYRRQGFDTTQLHCRPFEGGVRGGSLGEESLGMMSCWEISLSALGKLEICKEEKGQELIHKDVAKQVCSRTCVHLSSAGLPPAVTDRGANFGGENGLTCLPVLPGTAAGGLGEA